MHLLARGHFRSRDKYGGHTIRSAVAKTPRYTQTLRFYILLNWSYCRLKFYNAGIGIFDLIGSCDLDVDQMTFIYKLENVLRQDF